MLPQSLSFVSGYGIICCFSPLSPPSLHCAHLTTLTVFQDLLIFKSDTLSIALIIARWFAWCSSAYLTVSILTLTEYYTVAISENASQWSFCAFLHLTFVISIFMFQLSSNSDFQEIFLLISALHIIDTATTHETSLLIGIAVWKSVILARKQSASTLQLLTIVFAFLLSISSYLYCLCLILMNFYCFDVYSARIRAPLFF